MVKLRYPKMSSTASCFWDLDRSQMSVFTGERSTNISIGKTIHNLVQDTMFIATYFTKLKWLWDEVSALQPIPTCSSGALKVSIALLGHHEVSNGAQQIICTWLNFIHGSPSLDQSSVRIEKNINALSLFSSISCSSNVGSLGPCGKLLNKSWSPPFTRRNDLSAIIVIMNDTL